MGLDELSAKLGLRFPETLSWVSGERGPDRRVFDVAPDLEEFDRKPAHQRSMSRGFLASVLQGCGTISW